MNLGETTVRLEDLCPYCGRRCRVPVSRHMPDPVVAAYNIAGVDSMATCPEGATAEHRLLHVSYADVVADRSARARAPDGAAKASAPGH